LQQQFFFGGFVFSNSLHVVAQIFKNAQIETIKRFLVAAQNLTF